MRFNQKPDHALKALPTLGTLIVACCLGAAGCGAEDETGPSSNQQAGSDDLVTEAHAIQPADPSVEDSEEASAASVESDTVDDDSAEPDPAQDAADEESNDDADDAVEPDEEASVEPKVVPTEPTQAELEETDPEETDPEQTDP